MEPHSRARVTRTALALGSYVFHGMNNGVLGPSILDIAAFTNSSTLQAASCLTWRSIGTLGGLLSTGFLYDRYNEHLLLGLSMLIMGATVAVVPLCSNLTLMYMFLVINGVMQGSATVGHTGLPVKIWGAQKCGPIVQAIHLMSSLGSAIIPLILSPFLINTRSKFPHMPGNSSELVKRSIYGSTDDSTERTFEELLIKDLMDENKYPELHEQFMGILDDLGRVLNNSNAASATTDALLSTPSNKTFTTSMTTTTTSTVPTTFNIQDLVNTSMHGTIFPANDSHNLSDAVLEHHIYIPRIQYGYAVLATGLFIVSLFHFLFAIQKGVNHAKKKQHGVLVAVLPPWLVLFIFFWLGYFNGAIETVYGEVIQPFLDRHLGWSAKAAAFLISIFWFSQGGGRFLGIPIAKYVTPDKMLLGNTTIVIAAAVAIIFLIDNSIAVWICTILIAVGLSTERACEVSWLVLLIPFQGINNGILFCGIYAGKGLTPLIYGVLSRHFGQMVLMYMGFIMSVAMTIVVIICIMCVQCIRSKTNMIHSEDEIEKMLHSGETNNDIRLT